MSNVKAINGHIVPGEPNPQVVALLEKALDEARKGEISAVAIATLSPDGCSYSEWAHKADYYALLGAVARLQQRLVCD